MALFDPARDITQGSLGKVLAPVGNSIAKTLATKFPSLKNGLTRGGASEPIKVVNTRNEKFIQSKASGLVYPVNLPEALAFFKLELKKYQKPDINKKGTEETVASIYLPLPSDLSEAFEMRYNQAEFGPVLGDANLQRGVSGVADALAAAAKPTPGSEEVKQRSTEAGKFGTALGGSLKDLIFRAGARAFSERQGGAFADLFSGSTPNPGFALLFQSNTLRRFQYTWRFSPESQEESNILFEIIQTLKFAMHPGKKDLFLTFPFRAVPQITIKGQNLFVFKPCAIIGMNVNYAPGGVPGFFQDGRPIEISMSLALQETEILTREDFKLSGRTTE